MLDMLKQPIPVILENCSIADLATIQAQINRAEDTLKFQKEVLAAVLDRKYSEQARSEYVRAGKDTGTLHIPASNTLNLKIEVDKTVKWDQAKLFDIFSAMKPEDARHYAKVEYKVAEAKYTNAPPAVQEKLKTARTVQPGKMKFTFENAVDEVQEAA